MRAPKLFSLVAIFATLMLVLPGIVRAEEPAAFAIGEVATATVKSIDPAARTVTLEAADGSSRTVTCGKAVVNFDQIKVGDQVKAMAVGRVAVAVGKPGSADTSDAEDGAFIARAPQGSKPGIIIANTEEVTAKIDSIDAAKRMVTLTGPSGNERQIEVCPDCDLASLKQGDDITLKVTKGVALWVESPSEAGAQPAAERMKAQGAEGAAAMVAGETRTATVEAIDPATRMVTLKNAQGETKSIHLGKAAINFDKIAVGDKVRATLAEEVAVDISKGGAPPSADESSAVVLAPKGAKPGMLIADTDQITGKVQSIDADKRTITFAQADGTPKTVKAGQKVNLSDLKPGDDITARVTQALAIVVEKP